MNPPLQIIQRILEHNVMSVLLQGLYIGIKCNFKECSTEFNFYRKEQFFVVDLHVKSLVMKKNTQGFLPPAATSIHLSRANRNKMKSGLLGASNFAFGASV